MARIAGSVVLVAGLCVVSVGCQKSEAERLERYVETLDELPADLAATLDPVTLATRVDSAPVEPQLDPRVTAAPCCSSTIQMNLQVTYRYTKCGPLRDFIVAPFGDLVLQRSARSVQTHRLSRLGASVFDRHVCFTSDGPWSASLSESRACSPYYPVHQLGIAAYGDLVTFTWTGGVQNHPPDVGLVSCRLVATTELPCGISTCECRSTSCPAGQLCDCGLTW